jgi:hypothetical protein
MDGGKVKHKKGLSPHETGGRHQCQCDIDCHNPAIPGEAFCADHMDSCPRTSPLSGAEPAFEPNRWNFNRLLKETHNCFAYAYNAYDRKQMAKCKNKKKCEASFHQPGFASMYSKFSNLENKSCTNMQNRIFGDNPNHVIKTDFETQCPASSSKIAVIVDASDDYHFLRQDDNGYWSHKPGARRVTELDATGHRIWDPKLANYNYAKNGNSDLNYDLFCSYLCLKRHVPLYLKAGGGGGSSSRKNRELQPSLLTKPFRTRTTRRGSRGRK